MILVDSAIWPWRGKKWCHMVSDTSIDELHSFAENLGLKRAWFQNKRDANFPHYDLVEGKRWQAIRMGAVACSNFQLYVWAYRFPNKPMRRVITDEMRKKYPHPTKDLNAAQLSSAGEIQLVNSKTEKTEEEDESNLS